MGSSQSFFVKHPVVDGLAEFSHVLGEPTTRVKRRYPGRMQ
jgi:hypothetical protein